MRRLGALSILLSVFVVDRAAGIVVPGRSWQDLAGYNLGVVLGELGRSEQEIEVYDQLLARFADARNRRCGSRSPRRSPSCVEIKAGADGSRARTWRVLDT